VVRCSNVDGNKSDEETKKKQINGLTGKWVFVGIIGV
jgi:hypothetical protein